MKKILLGLTTTPGSDYFKKIKELKKFNITEIAFFPTAINQKIRKKLYKLFEKSPVKSIPHVHLRDDMERWELEYLEKKFKTKVFNIHSKNEEHCFPGFAENFSGFLHKTYIENMNDNVPEEEELSRFGGLCIDFSHWQDGILLGNQDFNKKMKEAAKNFPVGCSHISGVGREMIETRDVVFPEIVYRGHAKHFFDNLKELDYIENFLEFLPDLISLELENSFAEQLKAKAYLEKIIFHK